MRKNKREEENHAWRKREKKGKGLRFSVFQRLKVITPRIKVGLLDKSYEYVLKTKEERFSPILVPLNLMAM